VEEQIHEFLISVLDGGEWSVSRSSRFILAESATITRWVGGWVGHRAGLNAVVKRKIPNPCRELNPDCPARSLAAILTAPFNMFSLAHSSPFSGKRGCVLWLSASSSALSRSECLGSQHSLKYKGTGVETARALRRPMLMPYSIYSILIPWCRILFEKLIVTLLIKKYPAFFMEPESSSPCSQKPAIGPYPESDESSSPHRFLCP
jgi:hypothetical protein